MIYFLKASLLSLLANILFQATAQYMTPELLWSLGRLSPEMIAPDGKHMIYGITYYNKTENKGERNLYSINLTTNEVRQVTYTTGAEGNVLTMPDGRMGYVYKGQLYACGWDGNNPVQITNINGGISNVRISPDGNYILFTQDVKTRKETADIHPDLPKADAKIITGLMYRHWDSWEDAYNSHIFYASLNTLITSEAIDIMKNEEFDTPQMPFGGLEDIIWSADSKSIIYVCKKTTGTAYVQSTNTDIYAYHLETKVTTNLTEGMMGYDTHPIVSPAGDMLAWLSMERDGYEADKNRLFLRHMQTGVITEIAQTFDETINQICWSADGSKIFFTSPVNSSVQLYEIDVALAQSGKGNLPGIRQITQGQHDITAIIGEVKTADAGQQSSLLYVTKTDMNHAAEMYALRIADGHMKKITHTNDGIYDSIKLSTVEQHWIATTDTKKMLVNVILPPDFNPTRKYPVLVYCQGGPQSALSQFYSFRWNFQLMAANGYVVIAACRRGMPGFGTEWNEAISGDWGGKAIQDYLAATDWAKKLPYADVNKFAAIGASYGGYAVYMLAGVHDGRFASFIAHDGIVNTQSFYGTTEEIFFADFDMQGAFWENPQNPSYTTYNPANYISKWNTPMLIFQGGKDYRTTEDQAFQAFTALQLKGIKSKFIYFPSENHWVLNCQNALLWQREFYSWLKETLQ